MASELITEDFGTPVYQDDGVVGDPLTLDTSEHYPLTHWFVGVEYFSDAGLTTPVTPGAGTVAVTVVSKTGITTTVTGSPIDATAGVTDTELNFATNPTSIIFTPTGITTATHYRVTAVGNMT